MTLATRERRFALALLAPALLVLVITTTAPLVYLAWTSMNRIDLSMPWLSGFVGAQSCALPVPFQYEFQNQVASSLSATNAGDACVLSVALTSGAGPSAAGILHYRRDSPLTSVRYGFRIDTNALSGFTDPLSAIQLFSANSPAIIAKPLPVSSLLTLTLRGGSPDPMLGFVVARSAGLPLVLFQTFTSGLHNVRVEISVGNGTSGVIRYWIDHPFSAAPDGVIDDGGAGLDNAVWLGVIGAELGVSSPTPQFRAGNSASALVFDQIESNDDVLFADDFSSGAQ